METDENGEPLGVRWYDAWINPDDEGVAERIGGMAVALYSPKIVLT